MPVKFYWKLWEKTVSFDQNQLSTEEKYFFQGNNEYWTWLFFQNRFTVFSFGFIDKILRLNGDSFRLKIGVFF